MVDFGAEMAKPRLSAHSSIIDANLLHFIDVKDRNALLRVQTTLFVGSLMLFHYIEAKTLKSSSLRSDYPSRRVTDVFSLYSCKTQKSFFVWRHFMGLKIRTVIHIESNSHCRLPRVPALRPRRPVRASAAERVARAGRGVSRQGRLCKGPLPHLQDRPVARVSWTAFTHGPRGDTLQKLQQFIG